jgi:hypothetical protein
MARIAEVVTIVSLEVMLDEAAKAFANALQAKRVAEQVKDIPDAFEMLNKSVQMHEAEGFKSVRKIVARVVNKLAETSTDMQGASQLIALAESLELFPKTEEVKKV